MAGVSGSPAIQQLLGAAGQPLAVPGGDMANSANAQLGASDTFVHVLRALRVALPVAAVAAGGHPPRAHRVRAAQLLRVELPFVCFGKRRQGSPRWSEREPGQRHEQRLVPPVQPPIRIQPPHEQDDPRDD
ncbi:hypothetical protein ON010_g5519 [Phytophthora cinnamomi]|nr:hypothetical protein ON010_g5519 [Phytophthora cinnamomi]